MTKTFHSDLAGTSVGRMLSAGDPTSGSAGCVAMERVSATLDGRTGTFAFQQSGTLEHGHQMLAITVVPGSGTGGLAGIGGTLTLRIENGTHFYSFDYTLPAR